MKIITIEQMKPALANVDLLPEIEAELKEIAPRP